MPLPEAESGRQRWPVRTFDPEVFVERSLRFYGREDPFEVLVGLPWLPSVREAFAQAGYDTTVTERLGYIKVKAKPAAADQWHARFDSVIENRKRKARRSLKST